MRRFVIGFFAVIGVLVSLIVVLLIGVAIVAGPSAGPVADATVLSLNLNTAFPEGPPPDPLARALGEDKPTLRDLLDGLERAGNDDRVKGIYARLGDDDIGTAQVQEIRDAIAAFRAKGKFAVAYADTFGELSGGTHAYYLATAFDDIWLQPEGLVGLTGLTTATPFFRGTLDKLGVVPSFDHRSEYKTAMNEITEHGMTPAHREETEAIVQSVFTQIVHGIASGRGLQEAEVRALVDRGPLLTSEATQSHLIDHIGYRDQAEDAAKQRAGAGAKMLSLVQYLNRAGHPHISGPVVALIYGTGLIQRGASSSNPLVPTGIMGADTLVRGFDKAARDSSVKAILFRIDSPGGSAVASETIWQAVRQARKRGKPVIVSMGNVAGSGGYYVAAPADKIVAEPATLTGSIGVLAGKFITTGFWDKLGVSWDGVKAGENADMFTTLSDFSPAAHQRFEAFLDATYAGFKKHVAQGRGLDDAKVEEIAKGRVWTGQDAKARGLVDALGGFSTALQLAKQAAKIPEDQDVTLKIFPAPATTREMITRLLGGGGDPDASAGNLGTLTSTLRELHSVLQQAEIASAPAGSVVMPPLAVP